MYQDSASSLAVEPGVKVELLEQETRTLKLQSFDIDQQIQPTELLNTWQYNVLKRAIDLVLGLMMSLALLLPCIVIALLVRWTSKGSIFYREQRIGRNGSTFSIYKFRSMYTPDELKSLGMRHGSNHELQMRINKQHSDPRITPIGRILRNWSLDEIPQLINVMRGEMSLVGPRPIIQQETALYGDVLPYYLAAVPGLSGLWQVSGRSDVDFDRRAQFDAIYVGGWSLYQDFRILLKTFPVVLCRIGAR